jgi:D-glycero-D-manno-heptose 1,7-bisphosphate phosphatase
MKLRRAVFFDRDGTLMEDAHYCGDPALVRVFPGIPAALAGLKRGGFLTFIITNQSGIDATYFCPDAPGTPSTRRKPAPGMVLEAAEAFGVDLAGSYFIGDKCADVECGRRAGTATIQVLTGYGREQPCGADRVVEDAVEAVRLILPMPPR